MTIRLSLGRSPNNIVVLSEDAVKHYNVQIIEANLYVRKRTMTDYFLLSIKFFLKNPIIYNHIIVPKKILVTAGVQTWHLKKCFRERTCAKNDSNEHERKTIWVLTGQNIFITRNLG